MNRHLKEFLRKATAIVALFGYLASTANPVFAVSLTNGDIAITGMKTNGSPDAFTFVTFIELDAGTRIFFTDNGWTGSAFRGVTSADYDGSEGTLVFEVKSGQTIAAGTVINSTLGTGFTGYNFQAITGAGGVNTTGNLGFANSGDQLYAFSSSAAMPTTGNPLNNTGAMTHLSAMATTTSWTNASDSATGSEPISYTAGTSYRSSSVQNGSTHFNVTTALGGNASLTKAQWLTALGNSANWSTTTDAAFALPTTAFTLASGGGANDSDLSLAAATIDFGRVMFGGAAVERTITLNEAAGGSSTDTSWSGAITGAGVSISLSPNSGTIAANGGSQVLTLTLNSGTAGTASSSLAVTNSSNANDALASAAITGAVVNQRTVSATAVDFGRVMVNQSNALTTSLSSIGADTSFTRVQVGTSETSAGGVTVAASNQTFDSNENNQRMVTSSFSTSGSKSGSVSLAVTGEGLAGEGAYSDVSLNYTATAIQDRDLTGQTVNVGKVLVGTAVSGSATISTTGADSAFTRVVLGSGSTVSGALTATNSGATTFNAADVTKTVAFASSGFATSGAAATQSVNLGSLVSSGEYKQFGSAGDLVVVGYQDNGSPDSFSFANLRLIKSGQTIYFADSPTSADGQSFQGGETLVSFTATQDILPGTIVASNSATHGTWSGNTAPFNSALSFAQTGDEIYAFLASPTAGVDPRTVVSANLYYLDTGAATDSPLPAGLTSGTTAVFANQVAGTAGFNTGSRASGSKAQWLAAAANTANWSKTAQPTASISLTDATGLVGESLDSTVTVTIEADVYQAASVGKGSGQSGTVANGGTVSVTNAAASDGGQRAGAAIASKTLTGDSGWSVAGLTVGTQIAAGGTSSTTASFDATGRLNGTYLADLVVGLEHADQTIAGTAANDLGSLSWELSHNVAGQNGGGSAGVKNGQSYSSFNTNRGSGKNSAVSFAAGTASGNKHLSIAFSDAPTTGGTFVSDVLQLEGTGSDPIVLEIGYDAAALSLGTEQLLTLNWLDTREGSLTNGDWILSVIGNDYSGGGSTAGSSFLGSWASYVSANPGATASNSLGRYGVDTESNKVWAVINHNSEFVVAVPEPSALGLAATGLALAALGAWRRRAGRTAPAA
jgi:hypothetical protein